MLGNRILLVGLCAVLLAAGAGASVQGPLTNPSFEEGLEGWTTYTYSAPPSGEPGVPWVAPLGGGGFDVLLPASPDAPDELNVCGMQSWGGTQNGGVYQQFAWSGGAATIAVTARAFSADFAEPPPANDNGCRVRIGLARSATTDRTLVTDWVTFPWGDFWATRKLAVPAGVGNYTLFIEAYQPAATAIMSTLWDNVTWTDLPPILAYSGPTAVTPDDLEHPDGTARIEWTTNVPSTSRVEYGLTPACDQVAESDDLVHEHVVKLTGLQPSRTYYFRVISTALDYGEFTSDLCTVSIPIQITGITTRLSPDGVNTIVSWETDVDTTSQVEYGLDIEYGSQTVENMSLTKIHEVTITGLEQDTEYHFRVWARNEPLYTDAYSTDRKFRTLPLPSQSLQNGGFEGSHGSEAHSLYPWVEYTRLSGGVYHPIDGLLGPFPAGGSNYWFCGIQAWEGAYFVGASANYDFKNGGVFQRVYFPPNELCTLSARYITYRLGGTDNYTRARLGIDPNGGVDPLSKNVVWWSGASPTNDAQWHSAAVTTTSGSTGIVTAFVDMSEQWPIQWQVVAIDGVTLGQPTSMTIGQLKAGEVGSSAKLENKIVTYVDPDTVVIQGKGYYRVYIQEDNRSAGLAVLLDTQKVSMPYAGNRITVVGGLSVRNNEAVLIVDSCQVDSTVYDLPKPVAMSQSAIGGAGASQPALYASSGLCNVGLRIRVFGRVTAAVNEGLPGYDVIAYIDDGANLKDAAFSPGRPGVAPIVGMRVFLVAKPDEGVRVGDYIAVTGVLSVQLVDTDGWPDSSDEYYAYTLLTGDSDEWDIIAQRAP